MVPPSDPVIFAAPQRQCATHDAILQTLDRANNGIYLGKEYFVPTVTAWDSVPLIYAQDHPDLARWDVDPEAELKRIGGRLIKGRASGTRIELTGHPRLMTSFKLCDPEIEQGIERGEISTSTAFWAPHDEELHGTVDPHHILFFEERKDGPRPGDGGAFILNLNTDNNNGVSSMTDGALSDVISGLRADLARAQATIAQLQAENERLKDETREQEGKIEEKEEEIKEKKEEIEEKESELTELKTTNAQFLQQIKDVRWATFKARHIPPGMISGDHEKEVRAEFEEQPLVFVERLLDFRQTEGGAGGAEPLEFTAAQPTDAADTLAKMKIPSLNIIRGGEQ